MRPSRFQEIQTAFVKNAFLETFEVCEPGAARAVLLVGVSRALVLETPEPHAVQNRSIGFKKASRDSCACFRSGARQQVDQVSYHDSRPTMRRQGRRH